MKTGRFFITLLVIGVILLFGALKASALERAPEDPEQDEPKAGPEKPEGDAGPDAEPERPRRGPGQPPQRPRRGDARSARGQYRNTGLTEEQLVVQEEWQKAQMDFRKILNEILQGLGQDMDNATDEEVAAKEAELRESLEKAVSEFIEAEIKWHEKMAELIKKEKETTVKKRVDTWMQAIRQRAEMMKRNARRFAPGERGPRRGMPPGRPGEGEGRERPERGGPRPMPPGPEDPRPERPNPEPPPKGGEGE